MIDTLHNFGSYRASTLFGARAPAQFWSELGGNAQSYRPFAAAGSWVSDFFSAVPALETGPWGGTTFGILAGSVLQPATAQVIRRGGTRTSGGASPTVSRPIPSVANNILNEAADISHVSRTNRLSTGSHASLLQTSSRSKLPSFPASVPGRFASQAALSGNMPIGHDSFRGGASVSTAAGASPFGTGPSLPTGVTTASAAVLWRERLIEKAGTSLRSTAVAGAATLQSAALIEQWNSPIVGPPASTELLTAAAEGQRLWVSASQASNSGEASVSYDAASVVSGTMPSTTSADFRTTTHVVPSLTSVPAGTETSVASPLSSMVYELEREVLSQVHDMPWVPSLVAQPAAEIRTQPAQAAPASLTNTQMLSLDVQDLDQGEDLSILSAKMKSILDEEARRHGIDV